MVARVKQKKRGQRTRNRTTIILINCEGRNKTEKSYFRSFNDIEKDYIIKFVKGNETDPVGLVKATIDEYKNQCEDELGDKAYSVFDVDFDKENAINEARRLAEKNGVKIILSNPCFEVWYILHFEYSTHYYGSNDEVIKKISALINGYNKNNDVSDILKPLTNNAISNATRLEKYHKENSSHGELIGNPGSEVYKLVEVLNCK